MQAVESVIHLRRDGAWATATRTRSPASCLRIAGLGPQAAARAREEAAQLPGAELPLTELSARPRHAIPHS